MRRNVGDFYEFHENLNSKKITTMGIFDILDSKRNEECIGFAMRVLFYLCCPLIIFLPDILLRFSSIVGFSWYINGFFFFFFDFH